mmetsp:Transcript_41019/g.64043  ORF Transcript_41019/g.64043 Transcript_41019/m.64043 type:complete len:100 (-) Transcript_41019:671-970(-)
MPRRALPTIQDHEEFPGRVNKFCTSTRRTVCTVPGNRTGQQLSGAGAKVASMLEHTRSQGRAHFEPLQLKRPSTTSPLLNTAEGKAGRIRTVTGLPQLV